MYYIQWISNRIFYPDLQVLTQFYIKFSFFVYFTQTIFKSIKIARSCFALLTIKKYFFLYFQNLYFYLILLTLFVNLDYNENYKQLIMRAIIIFILVILTQTTQVDNLNLLLPQLREPSFELPLQLVTAKNDCFIWTSSDTQILAVNPYQLQQQQCSKQALVQLVKPGSHTSTIYITATNTATSSSLNIPVRIRKINKIQIITKSRMMNIKQLQKLQLFAYDADGNTFTSIQGLRFKWTLHQKLAIIEKVNIVNAQLYLPLKTRQNIEKKSFQSDLLIVKALNPGNLKIYVQCTQPGYQNLNDQITLSVHERFELKPGPNLYMSPSSSYQLYLERPNKQIISLPQSYYKIISCQGFQLNSTLYLSVPNNISQCLITIQDTRTVPSYQSSSTIHVEFPTVLHIITQRNIIVGQKSGYQIQLLHNDNILYGKSNNLAVQSSFNIDKISNTILAGLKMSGFISATLGKLNSFVEIKSWLPVRAILASNYMHLPVDQQFKFKVVGGSGSYDFSISNQIGTLNNYGLLSCKKPGEAKIIIADRYNPLNQQIIRLKISHIQKIHSLEKQKQVNKDEWSNFYIIGKSNQEQIYTQCIQSQFTLTKNDYTLQIDKKVNYTKQLRYLSQIDNSLVRKVLQKTSLLNNKQEQIINTFQNYVVAKQIVGFQLKNYVYGLQNYGICQIIRFRSLISFFQSVNINLIGHDNRFTKVPLRVYEPVSTSIFGDQVEFLMTPQSSLIWKYTGGIYTWSNSIRKIYINTNLIKDEEPLITCPNTQMMPTLYELKLQNQQTQALLFPVHQITMIKITCKFPKKIRLQLLHGDTFDNVLLNSNSPIFGHVDVTDQQGRQYYNASNVQYKYKSLTGDLKSNNQQFSYFSKANSDKIIISCENLISFINFPRIQHQFSISMVQPLKINHILFNKSLQEIQTKISTQQELKNLRKIIKIIILYTPKKPYILNFYNKHSQLSISCAEQVSCVKKQTSVLVNLLNPGIGIVIIKDKRVYGSVEWIYEFTIVEVDQVIVRSNKDYIPVGNTFNVTILNLYKQTIISPLLYQDNHLHLNIDSSLRILQQNGNNFLVRAQASGKFHITGEQTHPKIIKSKIPLTINVYQKIQPDSTNFKIINYDSNTIEGETSLIIGCKRLFRISGGPTDTITTFSADKQLQVSSIAINIYAITAKAQGAFNIAFTFTHHGQKINYIKMIVRVSKIQSIQLKSINQPMVGAEFRVAPIFKVGEDELQGCICEFQYKWSTLNKRITLGQWFTSGFITAGGVNATALSSGHQVVTLEILDKQKYILIGTATKDYRILNEINYNLPSFINQQPRRTKTMLIAPQSGYQFPKDIKIESSGCQQQILKAKMNVITALKRTGHATIKIEKDGYRSELIQIQITPISAIFIENQQGFIVLDKNLKATIPVYLQDNNGRLFSTPLSNVELFATSSNPEVASIKLINDMNHIELVGLQKGICVITVGIVNKNIHDTIVVTVGSTILPAYESIVLVGGNIQFSLPQSRNNLWISSNPQIATVNAKSGLATGLKIGRSKISNGQMFGWIQVTKITRFQQFGQIIQRQGGYQLNYLAIINFKDKQIQLSNWDNPSSPITNNFHPICTSSHHFIVTSQIITQNNTYNHLQCILKPKNLKDLPQKFNVTIKDRQSNIYSSFQYSSNLGFHIYDNKRVIKLSSKNPKEEIKIQTDSLISLNVVQGQKKWVKQSYDDSKKILTITIDMSNQKVNNKWFVELNSDTVTQIIEIYYTISQESKQSKHSFFSYSMDFPDYLILFMTIVFAIVCFLQYFNQQKLKNS